MTGSPEIEDLRARIRESYVSFGDRVASLLEQTMSDLSQLLDEAEDEVTRLVLKAQQTEEKSEEVPEGIDVDTLPLEQRLILEILQSRSRDGHQTWSIPEAGVSHLEALSALGLVTWDSGPVEGWVRASLTIRGAALMSAGGLQQVKRAGQWALDLLKGGGKLTFPFSMGESFPPGIEELRAAGLITLEVDPHGQEWVATSIPAEESDESEDGFTSAERSLLWSLWADHLRGAGSSLLSPEPSEELSAAISLSERGLVVIWPTDGGQGLYKITLTEAGIDVMRDLKETTP